jgi:hypothetical protein
MNLSTTLFINAGGLFDFDLTFPTEALFFLILAGVVTFVFLAPISKQLNERAEFIDFNLRKSTILLTFGYEKLSTCVGMLTEEITELNRQIKLVRNYTNSKFEEEISIVQTENSKILSNLKGDLSITSAYIFADVTISLTDLAEGFFARKFQSYN